MNAPDPQPLVFALSDVLNALQNLDPDGGYISATASWEQEDGRLRTLTLSVGAALDDEHEATDRPIRCPKCGGTNGEHGMVHTRYGNGGGGNRPCPNRPDGSRDDD